MSELPAVSCKNASTTFQYDETITDNIATWVKEGFAAGPFSEPPLKKFRVNSILATKQNDKVRTILNVSLPERNSLNDNINEKKLEKVVMSSARSFGFTVKDAGKKAWMAKFDMKDAYKNVPIPTEELRLQGFSWLGKYFVETRQIFGAKSAVSNFDVVGHAIQDLALAESGVNKRWVHRQLDDVPVACPNKSGDCQKFENSYKRICESCNIDLAESCTNFDKAFKSSKYGKVLGIWFDSENLKWKLPEEKAEKTKRRIHDALTDKKINLLQLQKLLGCLNDICLMCPFLQGFKKPLNNHLSYMQLHPFVKIYLSAQSKKDLTVFYNFLDAKEKWNPIPSRPYNPPTVKIVFTLDAAGCNENTAEKEKIGCASVGLNLDGEIFFAKQVFWSKEVLNKTTDKRSKRFNSKTTTLEFFGILLPFIFFADKLRNQHIVLEVDNIACVYAWQNKYAKDDEMASILVRCLHLTSHFLGSVIYIKHVPRKSTFMSHLADRLTRKSTTTEGDKKLIDSFRYADIPKFISNWMSNPTEDWDIVDHFLSHVESICA